MTISEAARRAGVSNQAVYKRLKARGILPDSIREKGSGILTEEGEALMRELFPAIDEHEARPAPPPVDEPAAAPPDEVERLTTEVERLSTRVDELTTEVDRLTTRLTTSEARAQALQDERDYLRGALDKSQQLQAMTAQKIPNPPPALTDGSEERPRRGLWARLTGRGRGKG